ncbi:MAG: ArsR family transcriptional regulator [Calditrichaeota bacterium]|nr:MAG: ArsR family transcriptional regulator [Calditrichota bacterium]
MNGRDFKDMIFEQFAKIANAFASPKRLEIIDILAQGERDVDSLARQASMTVANTSRHLQILRHARLVEVRRDGVRIYYRLADDDVLKCWIELQSLAEKRTAEVREIARIFFEERDAMRPISKEELQQRLQNNEVIVLDVRPEEEFRSGHIPGAVSIPLSQLQKRLEELPRDREVVAYCRGPYCVLSAEAMAILRDAGYHAVRLKEGLPQWRQAGLPVEKD